MLHGAKECHHRFVVSLDLLCNSKEAYKAPSENYQLLGVVESHPCCLLCQGWRLGLISTQLLQNVHKLQSDITEPSLANYTLLQRLLN